MGLIKKKKNLPPAYASYAHSSPCYMDGKLLLCVLTNLPFSFHWYIEISFCFLGAQIFKRVFKILITFYPVFLGVCSMKASMIAQSIKVPELFSFISTVPVPFSPWLTDIYMLPLSPESALVKVIYDPSGFILSSISLQQDLAYCLYSVNARKVK